MEELRKLEKVQRMLSFIDANGLTSSDLDCDRFLAHFLLLFEQPFGMLGIEKKHSLVLDFLKKVNTEILDDLNCFAIDEEKMDVNSCIPSEPQTNNEMEPDFTEMPLISLDAMQRSNSTLEDFCRSYFMFHGMDANCPDSIFKFLPFLSFIESYIYQLDTSNEKNLHMGSQIEENIGERSMYSTYSSDPFHPLISIIQNHGLFTDRISDELKSGLEYWALEVKLCQALARKQKILMEDVIRAIKLKSFDYRVLNLLLYKLTGEEVNELHMEFLSLSEFLVEISDDLYDYEV
ncbi:hypothetical protein LUZ60_017617 [Juncus effusus]|nr:hypothetical protein LUZ60_017617 [Juncus effusus]